MNTADATSEEQHKISQLHWFHSIDFGDGRFTPGRFNYKPPNYTLFGVFEFINSIDATGQTCLDIGTMDGLVSFILKTRGAKKVIATDLVSRPTFKFGANALGLDIDYQTPVKVEDLEQVLKGQKLDLIVNAGVLYHVLDPLGSIIQCRRLLKPDGLMLLESSHLCNDARSRMIFNPNEKSRHGLHKHTVIWRPSRFAIEGMLEVAGFEVLGSITTGPRVTILAKAIRPSATKTAAPVIRRMIDRAAQNRNYDENFGFAELESDSTPPSTIAYTGASGAHWITPQTYRPDVPLQPAWEPDDKIRAAGGLFRSLLRRLGFEKARIVNRYIRF